MQEQNDTKKFHFYTDGIKTIKIKPGEDIPEGFRKGRTFKVNTWNKGHTAETDERVKLNHQKTTQTRIKNGTYTCWSKGQTKETNESLKRAAEHTSKTRLEKFANCELSVWNKGKKASEATRKKLSDTRKRMHKSGELTSWNKGLTKYDHPSIMSTSIKATGRPCMVTDWEAVKRKEHETRTRNHSWQFSQPEEDYYKKLCEEYGEEDIIRQYVSELYPFRCDFYVKSLDLYIELNYSFDHESHPFDPNSEEDLAKVQKYREKASQGHPRYANIVYVWTERDPMKLKTMRDNKLNFKVIYKDNLIIEK